MKRTKIVLDADVIIHFAKGGFLNILPSFLKEYQFVVLDIVKNELRGNILTQLENQINFLNNIQEVTFGQTSEERKEYARLTSVSGLALGKGESACMVYCRYNHDVVGSSNTADVTAYCTEHGITYLTTNDFLYFGIQRGIITKEQAIDFITDARSKGSFPPIVDFDTYICSKLF